jgi:hypothetical protein
MLDAYKELIAAQYEAGLCTLSHCVERCPDGLWDARVARYPFSQVAFHTLFFTDLYLGSDPDALQDQAFHRANPTLFGDYEQLQDREPVSRYERAQIRMYLEHCRRKAAEVMTAETDATLTALSKFGRRRSFSRAELHVYNIRHVQHHAAQLILRLRLDSAVDIPWVGSGWREIAR